MSRRIIVKDPHPISEVIGSVKVGETSYDLKRGLLATLDAARAAGASFVTLATIQVAWYEETQHRVPASCQKTLERALAAA